MVLITLLVVAGPPLKEAETIAAGPLTETIRLARTAEKTAADLSERLA